VIVSLRRGRPPKLREVMNGDLHISQRKENHETTKQRITKARKNDNTKAESLAYNLFDNERRALSFLAFVLSHFRVFVIVLIFLDLSFLAFVFSFLRVFVIVLIFGDHSTPHRMSRDWATRWMVSAES